MTPAEKDALNREFHELLGKHLHEWTNKDDPKHPDRICTRCGVKITERNYADDVLDYVADPRLVLREMDRLGKLEHFLAKVNAFSLDEDGDLINNAIPVDYILDTTGLLALAARDFMRKEKP